MFRAPTLFFFCVRPALMQMFWFDHCTKPDVSELHVKLQSYTSQNLVLTINNRSNTFSQAL